MSQSVRRPVLQSGFVLAVTLWILAAIAVLAAMVSMWALSGVQDVSAHQEEVQDEIDGYSTVQTIMYLMATRDFTRAGLPVTRIDRAEYAKRVLEEFGALRTDPVGGELKLDDHVYAGLGNITFSIQDESGLMTLSAFNPQSVRRMVDAESGLEGRAARLSDELLDYIDEDSDVRSQGAETAQYSAANNNYVPANRRLATPLEIRSVPSWAEMPLATLKRIERRFTPYYNGPLNINTAPAEVLASYLPGCPATCDAVVALREQDPIRNTDELQRRLVTQLPGTPETDFRTMPEGVLRITTWSSSGHGWRWHVERTPEADKAGPWTILAAYPIFKTPRHAEPTGSPLLTQSATGSR